MSIGRKSRKVKGKKRQTRRKLRRRSQRKILGKMSPMKGGRSILKGGAATGDGQPGAADGNGQPGAADGNGQPVAAAGNGQPGAADRNGQPGAVAAGAAGETTANRAIETVATRCRSITTRLTDLATAVETRGRENLERLSNLERDLQAAETQNEETLRLLETLRADHQQELQERQAAVSRLEAEKQLLENQLREARAAAAAAARQQADAAAQAQAQNQQEVDRLTALIQEKENQITQAQRDMQELRDTNATLEQRITGLQAHNTELQGTLNESQSRLQTQEAITAQEQLNLQTIIGMVQQLEQTCGTAISDALDDLETKLRVAGCIAAEPAAGGND